MALLKTRLTLPGRGQARPKAAPTSEEGCLSSLTRTGSTGSAWRGGRRRAARRRPPWPRSPGIGAPPPAQPPSLPLSPALPSRRPRPPIPAPPTGPAEGVGSVSTAAAALPPPFPAHTVFIMFCCVLTHLFSPPPPQRRRGEARQEDKEHPRRARGLPQHYPCPCLRAFYSLIPRSFVWRAVREAEKG